jgi:predicted nuclease with TOPRIM domain
MATRTKMTPFARFFIMLLFVAPLAYLGAAYYNGEDGLQNIKDIFSSGADKVETVKSELQDMSKSELIETVELLEMKVEQLEQRIKRLESQNQ